MKFPSLALISLAVFGVAAAPEPAKPKSFLEKVSAAFELETLLTWRPVAAIFEKSGIDISQKFAEAKRQAAETGWDERIPMITDENYRELVVEEPLSLEELDKRVWFLLM